MVFDFGSILDFALFRCLDMDSAFVSFRLSDLILVSNLIEFLILIWSGFNFGYGSDYISVLHCGFSLIGSVFNFRF